MSPLRRFRSSALASIALLGILSVGFTAALFAPRTVHAQEGSSSITIGSIISALNTAAGACPGLSPCPPKGAADALTTLDNKVFTPMVQVALTTGILQLAEYALDRIAYESAVFLASGGKGQTPLLNLDTAQDAWGKLGQDLVGESLGQLSDVLNNDLNIKFNLCAPTNPSLRIGLQLGIAQAYQPRAPKCDFQQVQQNWSGFVSSVASLGDDPVKKTLETFALGLTPGQNELSASIGIAFGIQEETLQAKSIGLAEILSKQGYKDVTDFVTGQVKTPSSLLARNVEKNLVEDKNKVTDMQVMNAIENSNIIWGLFTHVASTFTNTFLATATSEIAKGLIPSTPGNPFDIEGLASNGRQAAIERFNTLITAQPISVANYNALAEFVVCPAGSSAQRNVNNCVLDANFVSAINRAEAGVPLTIQEAVDEGLIDGNWVLIPPTQVAKNQDPFCYTYGFCYSNLVKLRKARILPVGWEMAATINTGTTPKTLQEIMDAFDNCESGDPFCHLVDPNWVLKYPETQCKALVNGELLISSASGGRAGYCADTPSCVATDNDGNCIGGYGYCVAEKNIWRFRGEECPAQFASCLAFSNTNTGERMAALVTTVDFDGCNEDNAGCRWYRTNKFLDTKGTPETTDDSFSFLPTGTIYDVLTHDAAVQQVGSTRSPATENLYAHEDRVYFNNDVQSCDASSAGCGQLIRAASVTLNTVQNPSFETAANNGGFLAGWGVSGGTIAQSSSDAADGAAAVPLGAATLTQRDIELSAQSFYSVSVEAKGSAALDARVNLTTLAGASVNLAGISTRGCSVSGSSFVLNTSASPNEYARFTCTFSTGAQPLLATIVLSGNTLVDAVQLERGENATSFTQGYSVSNPSTVALKVPPAYLNCKGLPTDPAECASYAGVCSATEVGCELYTPQDGDPSVPAVASELDRCPSACVGYAAFKQEATRYEQAQFPQFFIPSTAQRCDAQFVGCDTFTNLNTVAAGGEGVETYTDLRACTLPDNGTTGTQGNYFTWEGTDESGFQLRSFTLLRSNKGGIDAPCSNFRMSGENTLVCTDDTDFGAPPTSCDDHDDIFTNPDCREFYNEAGTIAYRFFSDTVTVAAECAPYRKAPVATDAAQAQTDCEASGGFFLSTGDCRYLGLATESVQCPAAAAGCRAYTGSAGRNSVSIFNEVFESGTFASWQAVGGATAAISNDSVSAGGHSLRLTNMAVGRGVETTATSFAGTLVPGKTFMLEFWARGAGNIDIFLTEDGGTGIRHDFVVDADVDTNVALTAGWRPYTVGPLDTSSFAGLNDTAVLQFISENGNADVYLDNIALKQAEDNITLIKGSWSTPASCDQTPTGVASPQFFLGCEEYKDRAGTDFSFYQFTSLCSEAKVGCEAFYDTRDSSSSFGQTYNARCVGSVGPCSYLGTQVCTIQPGNTFCLFDYDGAIRTINAGENVALGPEARVISNDVPVFLVNNGSGQCSAAQVGCQEVGVPKFNAEKTAVTGFDTKYLIVDPLPYGDDVFEKMLCSNEELFCEEWASTKDGNFYFKHPLGSTCEYKTDVSINNRKFFGWFRAGTSEPCSYEDVNANGTFELGTDTPLMRGGEEFLLPLNGDANYEGFVASCETRHDLCTEFRDPTDTQNGRLPQGQPYYFKNNDALSEENVQTSQRCDGGVSQKEGCALFRSSTDPRALYSASATYTASNHADILFGGEAFDKVDPIDCSTTNSVITLPSNGGSVDLCQQRCAYQIGAGQRLEIDGAQQVGNTAFAGSCFMDSDCAPQRATDNNVYEGSCASGASIPRLDNDTNTVLKVNRDRECAEWLTCSSTGPEWDPAAGRWRDLCQQVELCSEFGVSGDSTFCAQNAVRDVVPLTKNTYVGRDVTWNGFEYSGYSVPGLLPTEYLSQVDVASGSFCVDKQTGETLGYGTADEPGTPNASLGFGYRCTDAQDCADLTGRPESQVDCQTISADIRLAYVAGSCDVGDGAGVNGEVCSVGFCRESGNLCSTSAECSDTDSCVKGYCEVSAAQACTNDTDCSGLSATPFCNTESGRCVNVLESQLLTRTDYATCGDGNSCSTGVCTIPERVRVGACINGACLTDIAGNSLAGVNSTVDFSCRGYPETTSPVPVSTVTAWSPTSSNNRYNMPIPQARLPGFENIATCTPYFDDKGTASTADDAWVTTGDCDCSYSRVTYGQGAVQAYFGLGARLSFDDVFKAPAVCSGGSTPGKYCQTANDCGAAVGGETVTCQPRSAQSLTNGGEGVPKKVCAGGSRNLQACSIDADCGNTGLCVEMTKKEDVIGFEGYCLERDTGIQTLGSQQQADQLCLTWYPVEQLAGSTNLFAKFEDAGFNEDAYYCAESDIFYTLSTSEQACAEDTGNGGSPARTNHDKFGENNNCFWSAYCPTGYFAVMTPALGTDQDDGDNSADNLDPSNQVDACKVDEGLRDCPYFCVPQGSTRTVNNTQVSCTPPTNKLTTSSVKYKLITADGASSDDKTLLDNDTARFTFSGIDINFDAYLLKRQAYVDALTTYAECQLVVDQDGMVDALQQRDFVSGRSTTSFIPYAHPGFSEANDFYENLHVEAEPFIGCKTIVQASSVDSDNKNAAWTDRTWVESGRDQYTIVRPSSSAFTAPYTTQTQLTPFGQTLNPRDAIGSPVAISSCESGVGTTFVIPRISGQCDADEGSVSLARNHTKADPLTGTACAANTTSQPATAAEGLEGRSFDGGKILAEGAEWITDVAVCSAGVCASASTGSTIQPIRACSNDSDCAQAIQCQSTSECNSGFVCSGSGSNKTCTGGGPLDGRSCSTNTDCAALNCGVATDPECSNGLVSLGANPTCRLNQPVFISDTVDTVKDRLGQIFAQIEPSAAFVWVGTEYTANPINVDTSIYKFDNRAFGDPSTISPQEKPTAPAVMSLQNCNGVLCQEGQPNTLSLNGFDGGVITGANRKHVSLQFFIKADEDQLPVREIHADWGAGNAFTSSGDQRLSSIVGSFDSNNYYKNQRGVKADGTTPICGTGQTKDLSADSCDTSFRTFENDYTCNQALVSIFSGGRVEEGRPARICEVDANGRLLNSPCTGGDVPNAGGKCVYQPRVFVQDNWGWCTGRCTGNGNEDGNNLSCFGDRECSVASPVSSNDPWVYFDGFVIVEP